MKINTYGIEMKGLRKASGDTININPYSMLVNRIYYDIEEGEVIARCMMKNNEMRFFGNVIYIMSSTRHITMQEIANSIRDRLEAEH